LTNSWHNDKPYFQNIVREHFSYSSVTQEYRELPLQPISIEEKQEMTVIFSFYVAFQYLELSLD
jgi:hypothetical protein